MSTPVPRFAHPLSEIAEGAVPPEYNPLFGSANLASQLLQTTLEGIVTIDASDHIVYVNPRFCQMLGYANAEELTGRSLFDLVFPEDRDRAIARRQERRRGTTEQYEARLMGKNGQECWTIASVSSLFEHKEYAGTFSLFTDITGRKRAEQERDCLVTALEAEQKQASAIFTNLTDGVIILSPAGALLQINPAALQMHAFSDVEDAQMRLTELHTRFEFRDGVGKTLSFEQSPVGRVFGGETFSHQETHVVQTDVNRSWWGSFAGTTVKNNRGEPLLVILTIREITQIKQAQLDLTRALQRDLLLHEIGQKLRLASDAPAIRRIAVETLGEALHADRCYFVTYNPENDMACIGPDWKAGGEAAPAARLYPFRANPLNHDAGYLRGETQIVNDILLHPLVAAMPPQNRPAVPTVRAVVRVPLTPGKLSTALTIVMMHDARNWTQNEIRLAENLAIQTQSALDALQAREHDHRIATSLQEALLPEIPPAVPGLHLGKVYRAALDEAFIGGDFYDVFSPLPGRTALVVGDVSGKGLAGATQVSAVRNMLRAVLGTHPTWANAVTTLNRLLCEQNLLQSFVTLFVGVYDRANHTLTWVSCGHEAGLLRRGTTGDIAYLEATGIPLGVEPDAEYTEETVSLFPGDALLLHTDGLTEAGPNRREMLDTGGVVRLFEQALHQHPAPASSGANEADAIVRAVFNEAEAFARGDLRDDVCLLLAQAV